MQPVILETARGSVRLRAGTISDAEQYRNLRLFALQESPTAFSADYEVNAKRPMSFWEGRLNNNENGSTFIAEHDHHLIGMMVILKGELPKLKHSAEILSVYVHPEWRGLRIADALIEMCITWAKSKDVVIVKLGVNSANKSAVRCYQRCGFTIYGTEPRGTFYGGKYYDGYWMSRSLDES